MSQSSAATRSTTDVYAEWAITVFLFLVFATAFAMSLNWPAQTAFLPRLLSGAGALLVLFKLVGLAISARSAAVASARVAAPVGAAGKSASGDDDEKVVTLLADVDEEDQGNEDELKDVFTSSPLKLWVEALSWLAGFFVAFYLLGLLVVLPLFSILYLHFVGKLRWWVTLLYVGGTAAFIYFLFIRLLHLPIPLGVFPLIQI